MHVAPAFSCLEIVDIVYHDLMREGDTFIMSKGHGAMAQYVILEDMGKLNLDDYGKSIGCHPDLGVPGIACSTGSLGHGLGMAIGMAYADPASRVFVLLSDGELMEGSTWEALMLALSLDLMRNMRIHVDFNGFHSSGKIPWIYRQQLGAIREIADSRGFLSSIVLHNTVKGKGVSFMENNPIWHYRSPSPEEYQKALQELA